MKKFTELYYNKSKKSGMSIAYAIVSLVIAAVAIVALTPVLTRKLPNLATSSAIKHPKGWYESYNAPDDPHVKFCIDCCKADGVCKPDGSYNKNPDPNTPPSAWPAGPIYVADAMPPECIGNPKCNPYVENPINDLNPFEKYCKPNGTCLPPQHCEGSCRFKPPKGVSKYVVYAIGGGGGSGSAVASNTSGHLWSDISGNYKKIVGGRNNYDGVDKYSEYTPIILPKGADTPNSDLDDSDNIVDSHFIDMNRKNTAGTAYKPENFVNDQSNSNNLYPNRLESSIKNPECATGILYTVGDESRNFHIYPTEDADERLAKDISDKQVKRILKELGESENKTYKIGGSLNFYYYDRYYLYTHELGVYGYNQNPVYSLMPEWIKLKPGEKKYPNDEDFHKYVDGTDTSTYCNNKTCDINYYSSGTCGSINNNKVIVPITSKYKTVAAVACSGDGASGGDAICSKETVCDWMKPSACVYDVNDIKKEDVSAYTDRHQYRGDKCGACNASANAPSTNSPSPKQGYYCFLKESECEDKEQEGYHEKTCYYDKYFINRECVFKPYTGKYVSCKCANIPLPPRCHDNEDSKTICANSAVSTQVDPTIAADLKNLMAFIEENFEDALHSDFIKQGEDGTEARYALDTDGWFSDVTDPSNPRKVYQLQFTKSSNPNKPPAVTPQEVRKAMKALNASFNCKFHKKGCFGYEKTKEESETEAVDYYGGGEPECTAIRPLVRTAYGGRKGFGICVYKTAAIEPNAIKTFYTFPSSGQSANKSKPASGGCSGTDGSNADPAYACINDEHTKENNNCAVAHGGLGGKGGKVNEAEICSESSAVNGEKGGTTTTSKGGTFRRVNIGSSALKYSSDAQMIIPGSTTGSAIEGTVGANITGTQKTPGIYNFRYIWYMPFVTKHLMFGTAGSSGEELIVTVTLSESQTLETMPGKGANKTNYKSGTNGLNGGDSLIRKTEIDSPQNTNNFRDRANYVAHGGKGGIGNQKTDEYLLCHRSDLQGTDPKLPCYAKRIGGKIVTNKKTHYYENGKFKGIQAIKPKVGEKGMTVKMSEALKGSNPGIGAMGFGTESVSDFICEERHIDKLDQVNSGYARKTVISSSGIGPDGAIDDKCKGNSKIRYILPNAKDYASSTGAVIIMW